MDRSQETRLFVRIYKAATTVHWSALRTPCRCSSRHAGGVGEDAVEWMKANVHPLDIVFRLAEDYGIVLLNGSGFAAPDWSVRISFANLDDHVYDDIGRALRAIARGYRQAYEAAIDKSGAPVAV